MKNFLTMVQVTRPSPRLRLRELDTPRNDNGLDAVGEPGDFWSKPFCGEGLRNLVCAKQVIALNMLVEVLEGQSSQCRLS